MLPPSAGEYIVVAIGRQTQDIVSVALFLSTYRTDVLKCGGKTDGNGPEEGFFARKKPLHLRNGLCILKIPGGELWG
jgi:hypothetical protein